VVRPKEASSANKKPPLIVLFYGGGYVVGTPKQVVRPARDFAKTYGAVVICPSYKLSPENAWPAPMISGWEVVEYLAKNAEAEYGVNLDGPDGGFVLGGFSAGAGIAAIVAGIATYGEPTRDGQRKLAKTLTGVFLGVPHLLAKDIVPEQYNNQWTAMEENKGVVPMVW
jgi:acetyl esterase/lipase